MQEPGEPGGAEQVLAYHHRTKHHLERYAAGPERLDWSAQPDPFRVYAGSERIALSLKTGHLSASFADIHLPGRLTPRPLSLESIGALLGLSMGLSAWKEHGRERWALRCNPSSGNLHPTEAYVLCRSVPELADGVYHYVSRDHVLERRCALRWTHAADAGAGGGLWIALSSVLWREAWKYGERSFRYCQLDAGHAVGAVAYAAAVLGWTVRLVGACDDGQLARLLGLDRSEDYAAAEREHPDLLLAVLRSTEPGSAELAAAEHCVPAAEHQVWTGQANLLDPHPVYRWPVIDAVARASLKPRADGRKAEPDEPQQPASPPEGPGSPSAVAVIRGRRSAQQLDPRYTMPLEGFYRLLDSLSTRYALPWHTWGYVPRIHLAIFVHRVAGLAPGLYALPRRPGMETVLPAALQQELLWRRVDTAPDSLPLYLLFPADCRHAARTISCHQAIAGDGAFSLGMLAELGPVVREHPWRYRQLFWEAGLLGQVLYLQAEAMGVRGTGIGCYFDDAMHTVLGIEDELLQSMYHFTVGRALLDERIRTLPPYPESTLT